MKKILATIALVCVFLATVVPAGASQNTPAYHIVFQGTAQTSGTIKTTPIWCYQACVFPPPPPCTGGGRNSPPYCLQDIDATINVTVGETAATIAQDTLRVLNTKKRLSKEYSFQISPTNSAEIDATPTPNSTAILAQVHFELYPAGVSASWFLNGSGSRIRSVSARQAPSSSPGFNLTILGPALGPGPIQSNLIKISIYWSASGVNKTKVALVPVGSSDSASSIASNTVGPVQKALGNDFTVQVSPTDSTTVVASPNPASNVTNVNLRLANNVEGVYETWVPTSN